MLVIPTGTDAPIYHWPYATVGLIVLNVALLFLVPPVASEAQFDDNGEIVAGSERTSPFEQYSLTIGDGRLHPIQWVTHNFLHLGILHLAGNMLFLWAFGIVVEGKLGPLKYLATYLAIGTMHGALMQTLTMQSGLHEHAAGASAEVYGLLAICMLWAPRNELNTTVILTAGFRIWVFQWELYYTTVALYYVGTQVLGLVFWGSLAGELMLTELGHLSGALCGALVGLALLKTGLVDCEGWDVFSLWSKRQKLARDWKLRGKRLGDSQAGIRPVRAISGLRKKGSPGAAREEREGFEAQSAGAVRRIHRLIEAGNIPGAIDHYREAARTLFDWPSQPDLYAMIKALQARGADVESVPLMRDHCRNYPEESAKVRLKLAQVLIRNCERPAAAIRLLEEPSPGPLSPDLERARQKLLRDAERMRAEGLIEVEGDD
ncbi:MAG: rhomboid family intramembrane serine protease [Isosphaeraceae bacterium]